MTKRCTWCGTDPLYVALSRRGNGVFLHWTTPACSKCWCSKVPRQDWRGLRYCENRKVIRSSSTALMRIASPATRIANWTSCYWTRGSFRNRLKVYGGTRQNARAFLAVQDELGSFSGISGVRTAHSRPEHLGLYPRVARQPARYPTCSAKTSRSAVLPLSDQPSCMRTCRPPAW